MAILIWLAIGYLAFNGLMIILPLIIGIIMLIVTAIGAAFHAVFGKK